MSDSFLYGNKGAAEQRKKREEQQVELRRQRTEDLLNKKRVSNIVKSGMESSLDVMKGLLFSTKLEDIYRGAFDCRTALSVENNPPIQIIIDSGIVPRFVELLDPQFYEKFENEQLAQSCRFETAWVLTNIASGDSEQTKYIVRLGVVPFLINMISENNLPNIDQGVWALGNIAGDSEELRDVVLEAGCHRLILELIKKFSTNNEHIKMLRNFIWLLSNLNRGRNPLAPIQNMKEVLPIIEVLIYMDDCDIVSDCFWCLSYIADASSELIDMIESSTILKRCYALMQSFTRQLKNEEYDFKTGKIGFYAICPMIRLLGNIVTGNERQTDVVIDGGFLEFMPEIYYKFQSPKLPKIRKEICWLISNVTAGTGSQVQYIFKTNIYSIVLDSISSYELFIRKEAGYAVLNLLNFCSKNPHYLQSLIENKLVTSLQNFLGAFTTSSDVQALILDCVAFALEGGEALKKKTGVNPVHNEMLENKLVDEIEDLQDSKSSVVAQKAYNIIIKYFDGVDEEF